MLKHWGVFILVFGICGVAFVGAGDAVEPGPVFILSEGWYFRWGDPENGDGGLQDSEWALWPLQELFDSTLRGTSLRFRKELPSYKFQDPVVFVSRIYTDLEVYLDEESLYSYGDVTGKTASKIAGIGWHMASLPEGFGGKNLTIRLRSDYNVIGIRGTVLIGERSTLIKNMIIDDLDRLILLGIVMFICLCSFILFALNRRMKLLLWLGLLTLFSSLYMFRYTQVKQLISYSPQLWFTMSIVSFHMFSVSLAAIIEKAFPSRRINVMGIMWRVFFFYSVISISAYITVLVGVIGISGYYYFLLAARILFLSGFPVGFVYIILHVMRGDADSRLVMAGIVGLGIFTLVDALGTMRIIPWSRALMHWGIFLFIIAFVLVLGRRWLEMYRNLGAYSRELEQAAEDKQKMIQELHDGLGGIITNIHLISELSMNPIKNTKSEESFTTISSLTSDGIEELRRFMQSLDDEDRSWVSFAAEFRVHSLKVLTPHSITLDFVNEIEKAMPAPTGAMYLNLFRIGAESLTNVIKHAGADTVLIKIIIDKQGVTLSICDNGQGFSSVSNHGRGIAGMRTRAEAIGGTLTMDSNNGTSITVVIPFRTQ